MHYTHKPLLVYAGCLVFTVGLAVILITAVVTVVSGCRALRLLASPGKSGSAFFLSDDDRFLIKTVQQEEMRLLLELIPKYYRHVETNSGTLLTRFHGLHMVKPVGGAKSRVRSHCMSVSVCVYACVCVCVYLCVVLLACSIQ